MLDAQMRPETDAGRRLVGVAQERCERSAIKAELAPQQSTVIGHPAAEGARRRRGAGRSGVRIGARRPVGRLRPAVGIWSDFGQAEARADAGAGAGHGERLGRAHADSERRS